MQLYAAIEYCVAAAKRDGLKWAPRGKKPPALALSNHASIKFKEFVGDSPQWSMKLHDMYNEIRHDPIEKDPEEAYWFAESARILILSIALDYASQQRTALDRLLSDHRLERLGQEIRDRVT